MTKLHQTVLLTEAIDALMVKRGDIVVDATVGGAGHFVEILSRLCDTGTLVGIDADEEALERARAATRGTNTSVHFIRGNFGTLSVILKTLNISSINGIVFDLGWSAHTLHSGKGFSFQAHEPLIMTYGEPEENAGVTAASFINSASEEQIADVLYTLAEERFARRIAHGIILARRTAPILTTDDLVRVVSTATPRWYQERRIHPATKTFQALRMHVNNELGVLRDGIDAAFTHLASGGRVAVITFHSVEDRIVKMLFRDAAYRGIGHVLTKKVIVASRSEILENPRARSAKLRIFEKNGVIAPQYVSSIGNPAYA